MNERYRTAMRKHAVFHPIGRAYVRITEGGY
jgi:hypothetical protein